MAVKRDIPAIIERLIVHDDVGLAYEALELVHGDIEIPSRHPGRGYGDVMASGFCDGLCLEPKRPFLPHGGIFLEPRGNAIMGTRENGNVGHCVEMA